MTFRPGFPAAVLLFAVVSAGNCWSDPQPGTPGNSGDHNPHGTPPGQGGAIPGNSGDNNPHGTPPGQRITTPGAPGSPGTAPGNAATPSSLPAAVPSVNGLFQCPPNCPESSRRDQRLELVRFLATVEGWEPRWDLMAEPIDSVQVIVRTTETWGSLRKDREVRWQKAGGRERGYELLPEGISHEWLLEPGVHWSRWGTVVWESSPLGPPRRLTGMSSSQASVIENAWAATPVSLERKPWGRVVGFTRHRGAGRMAWEVEEATGQVRRIVGWDSRDRLEWDETRECARALGRVLVVKRHRIVPGGEITETLEWQPATGEIAGPVAEEPVP